MIIEMKCYFMLHLHSGTFLKHFFFQIQVTERLWKTSTCLEMKITKLFFFQCDKIAWRSLGTKNSHTKKTTRTFFISSAWLASYPFDLIKLAIPEKAQIFGFKMHSEKKVIKIKTECCCSHGLLLKHKLRHY